MSTYLLIDFLIIIFPLFLSFDKKVTYYKNFLSIAVSSIIVGVIYIIWDSVAVSRGDWSFNQDFVTGYNIFNLPVEEVIFFITVPYSCIFIYEVIRSYFRERELNLNIWIVMGSIIITTGLAVIFSGQYYTFTVLLFSALFLLIAYSFFRSILKSRVYWLSIIVSYLPFFIVNYFLTSLPVVEYNEKAVWGIRIITIPLEDFLYSYSLISFWLIVYLISKNYLSEKFLSA
jgi:lycopene cyclase domain-containing protein